MIICYCRNKLRAVFFMKIAVVTDSTSYIDRLYQEQNGIVTIPLNIIFEQDSYAELEEITTEEFYEKMRQTEIFPKTSQPAIGEVVKVFERLLQEYEEIVCVTLPSGISGSYQTFCTAAQMVDEERISVFDSEASCAKQAWYVYEAVRLRSEGKNSNEIIDYFEKMNDCIRAYFIADDLNHLQRGGRLSGVAALIGGLLQVKPILHFENKLIVPFEKIRTRKKAIKRIYELMQQDVDKGKNFHVCVVNGDCPTDGKEIVEEIKKQFTTHVLSVSESFFGPVIGSHLGPGALAITWYMRPEENE